MLSLRDMIQRSRTGIRIAAILFCASLILLGMSVVRNHSTGYASSAARRVQQVVSLRLSALERRVDDPSRKVPSDMVIYRYIDDSLYSWSNRFPLTNDDISRPVIDGPRRGRHFRFHPLSSLTDTLSFCRFGHNWYVAAMSSIGQQKTVYALEIMDENDREGNGKLNPKLHLPARYTVKPLDYGEGEVVSVNGQPLFKVVKRMQTGYSSGNITLIWLSLLLFVVALIVYLSSDRTLRNLAIAAVGIILSQLCFFLWGWTVQDYVGIFSPSVFAAGNVLYSLGAVVIINFTILALVACLYIVREQLKIKPAVLYAAAAGILIYGFIAFRSIILNSIISLELYKIDKVSLYTAMVYLSFLLLFAVPSLLVKMVRPQLNTRLLRAIYSIAVAGIIVFLTAFLGFRKEEDNVELWGNRLAIDRNISLEIQLRRCEGQIASDPVIAATSHSPNSGDEIGSYLIEKYLSRPAQDYDIAVLVTRDCDNDEQAMKIIADNLRAGETIAGGSHFIYSSAGAGHIRYTGIFLYYDREIGLSRMMVGIEAKTNREEKGYNSILGFAAPGQVTLPSGYSYAKYAERELQFSKGNFAYPTKINDAYYNRFYREKTRHFYMGTFTHFVIRVGSEETVVISRPSLGVFSYAVAVVFLALLLFLLLSLMSSHKDAPVRRHDYRRSISLILMTSLTVTLIAMVLVSVLFVYRRNDVNKQTIMSEKINAIHSLIESEVRKLPQGPDGVDLQDVMAVVQNVSRIYETDITLYNPRGKVMLSTVPEVFSRMLLGGRIDEQAFKNIVNEHKRFFIQSEEIGQKRYYSMYAPLYNGFGVLQAIICAPYTDNSYDFENDAVMHSVTIVVVFIILLLIARITSGTVLDHLLKPLSEMGKKMNEANLNNLEHIEYNKDDELKTLVGAYNRMVDELTESSHLLAVAERDKAWTGMARQVAHEIKNPLTPMKLQIQRLIRLKQKGDPKWADVFDEVSSLVLDHIDILSETAGEFSDIAKLPTEQMTVIDLDLLLCEEVSMFSARDNVSIEYRGLEGAKVTGPKPQLTRVIVNLLTNAVQAIPEDGRILVSLRHSSRDGYYDIVVEDNGPGVSEENLDKLFTPNFTTKTAGSGLGLAISRSILQRCNATIGYSRSFSLGGACFTVCYPR